jgi:hypothetical protein
MVIKQAYIDWAIRLIIVCAVALLIGYSDINILVILLVGVGFLICHKNAIRNRKLGTDQTG